MPHLIRTTVLPWIAALWMSFSGVALGEDTQPPTERKLNPTAEAPARVDHSQRGYWQPGGYKGRIGSPYYYGVREYKSVRGYKRVRNFDSIPDHGVRGHTVRRHEVRRDGCECGRHHSRRTITDPYTYHFGPGYYRSYEHGQYRFPYYSYRRPWYYPGQPVFNRDTNFAW